MAARVCCNGECDAWQWPQGSGWACSSGLPQRRQSGSARNYTTGQQSGQRPPGGAIGS
jgi:hypothetical protein